MDWRCGGEVAGADVRGEVEGPKGAQELRSSECGAERCVTWRWAKEGSEREAGAAKGQKVQLTEAPVLKFQ